MRKEDIKDEQGNVVGRGWGWRNVGLGRRFLRNSIYAKKAPRRHINIASGRVITGRLLMREATGGSARDVK